MPGRPRRPHHLAPRQRRGRDGVDLAPERPHRLNDDLAAACRRWGAEIESVVAADYSAVAFVRLRDGTPAVAKLPPTYDGSAHEGDALAAWAGVGAVRLLGRSPEGVLLLERAEPGDHAPDDEVLAASLPRLWIDPPPTVPWLTADGLAAKWSATVARWRDRIGHRLVDAAGAAFDAGFPPGPRVLLHGDGHHGNVLDGSGRGWLAIDPQPLLGPPALDLAPALWNGPDGPVGDRIAVLAATAGVDPEELARLALPRAVLSAAWVHDDGEPTDWGERALAVARALQ